MATIVTLNGIDYEIPAYNDKGWAQGTGNLSSYLVAVATAIGGGGGGGQALIDIVSVTGTTQAVTTGKTYLVATVSHAVSLNMPVPAANDWFWVKDVSSNAAVHNITLVRHGTEKINGVAANKVLSISAGEWLFACDGTDWYMLRDAEALNPLKGSNQLIFSPPGIFTTTLNVAGGAASRTTTLPDPGASGGPHDASILLTEGPQTINGVNTFTAHTTFTNLVTVNSSGLQLKESGGGSDVVSIAVAALAAGRTYELPDAGGDEEFILTGDSTITGNKTFTGSTVFTNDPTVYSGMELGGHGSSGNIFLFGSNGTHGGLFLVGVNNGGLGTTVEVTNAPHASDALYTIPDVGAINADFVMSEGAQTINGTKTFGADVAMGSHKITGMANGVSSADATTVSQMNTAIAAAVSAGLPPGVMVDYGAAAAPSGWLLCDGSAVSRTTYAALFAVIGVVWGAGNGTTTFNVPDSRGRSSMGAGTGSGLTARVLGTNVGTENNSTQLEDIGSAIGSAQAGSTIGTISGLGNGLYQQNGGGAQTAQQKGVLTGIFAIVQPNFVATKIIKT